MSTSELMQKLMSANEIKWWLHEHCLTLAEFENANKHCRQTIDGINYYPLQSMYDFVSPLY